MWAAVYTAENSIVAGAAAYLVKAEIQPPILVLSSIPLVSYFFHYQSIVLFLEYWYKSVFQNYESRIYN